MSYSPIGDGLSIGRPEEIAGETRFLAQWDLLPGRSVTIRAGQVCTLDEAVEALRLPGSKRKRATIMRKVLKAARPFNASPTDERFDSARAAHEARIQHAEEELMAFEAEIETVAAARGVA